MKKKLLYILFYFFLIINTFFISSHDGIFKLGVENISLSLLRTLCPDKKDKAAIGLITNQTGVDQHGKRTVDILKEKGFDVSLIFVPEHGLNGTAAEKDVYDTVDTKTNISIISLYGNGSGKIIQAHHLAMIDCLIFDIQDSGMRHYTYISTLLQAMKIAAAHNKCFIVLDRPNPLGSMMDGPLVDPGLISFISIAPIPLRHGMTIGELALYFNDKLLEKKVSLHVVKMSNYDRKKGFVGKLHHQLSPNIKSLQSVYGYSFLGLLGEIKPFNVGVGTPQAFQCITMPEGIKVNDALFKRLQLLLTSFGVKSTPYNYYPHKKRKKRNIGLKLEISAISNLDSFQLFIAIIKFFKQENIPLAFSASFNKAVGTSKVQDFFVGKLSEISFFNDISDALQQFYQQVQPLLLYKPVPVISKVPMSKSN